jgi:hypothetical protein
LLRPVDWTQYRPKLGERDRAITFYDDTQIGINVGTPELDQAAGEPLAKSPPSPSFPWIAERERFA